MRENLRRPPSADDIKKSLAEGVIADSYQKHLGSNKLEAAPAKNKTPLFDQRDLENLPGREREPLDLDLDRINKSPSKPHNPPGEKEFELDLDPNPKNIWHPTKPGEREFDPSELEN